MINFTLAAHVSRPVACIFSEADWKRTALQNEQIWKKQFLHAFYVAFAYEINGHSWYALLGIWIPDLFLLGIWMLQGFWYSFIESIQFSRVQWINYVIVS